MTRALKLLVALPLLLLLGLCGAYFVRNPERGELTDEARTAAPGRFVRLGAGATHYELREPEGGVPAIGRTAVLVHGFSVPYYVWDSTAVALARAGYRVLRYDLFGRGWSDRPDVAYDAALYVGQLAELLDSLGVKEPVDLMGLSMGGWVTGSFAAAHPARLRTLTLVAPVSQSPDVPWFVTAPVLGPVVFQTLAVPGMAESQRSDFVHPERFPDWVSRYEPQMRYRGFGRALRGSLMALSTTDLDSLYARAGRAGVPVLLVWGTEDTSVPIALSDRVRKAIPSVRYVVVDSAGHLPHMERSTFVHEEILRFLAGSAPPPPGVLASPADSTR